MNNNSSSETTVMLDYEEKKNMAIVVDKFIKQEMVYKLNTEAKFTIYSDVYIKSHTQSYQWQQYHMKLIK